MTGQETTLSKRDHALLIGDGFLITAAVASVGIGISFGLSELQSVLGDIAIAVGSGLLMWASGVAGVVVAWLLHGRRIDGPVVIGGLAGAVAGGFAVPALAAVSYLLGLPLGLVTDSEFAGPLALLVLIAIAVAVLVAWLVADAVRDLAGARRAHVRLDVARIAAATALLVLVAVSVYLVFAQPAPEQGEAPIFALAAGLVGAGVVAGADLATVVIERQRRSTPTPTPAAS